MSIREQVIKLAEQVGDPIPHYSGGPDSQALVDWSARWLPVERALKIGAAATNLFRAAQDLSNHWPANNLLAAAVSEYEHQYNMLTRGL